MSPQLDVAQHLKSEITASDPWKLDSNPFEHRRYAVMLDMIRARGTFERGLEVGCAGGVFTELMAPHCRYLHVIDIMPEGIEKTRKRLGDKPNITWQVASVTDDIANGATFDLIVVAEVLCYLPDLDTLKRAVANLAKRLNPGGLLVFGLAVDETVARWGLFGGAETTMKEWETFLREVDQTSLQGSYWGENCRIVAYTSDGRAAAGAPDRLAEDRLIPHKAVTEIPAKSVVVLAPHADDEAFGCGGAIMRHVDREVPVKVVIATADAGADPANPGDSRRDNESRLAASILGYGEPEYWHIADRSLVYGEALTKRVMEAIGEADLIYAPALSEVHPDHRALGMAAAEAVKRLGGERRLAFYEVGAPLKPNLLLDISDLLGRKQAAMESFGSQLQRQRYDQQLAALNRYRTYTLSPTVSAAEAYFIVTAEELKQDPLKLHRPDHERRLTEAALGEQKLKLRIAELESQLRAMHESHSWKVTAPLRAASMLVSRLRGRAKAS